MRTNRRGIYKVFGFIVEILNETSDKYFIEHHGHRVFVPKANIHVLEELKGV